MPIPFSTTFGTLPHMGTHLPKDEMVTDSLITYYVERARGGAALITVESTRLQFRMKDRLSLYDDRFIPGLKKLADAIRAAGAKAAIQFYPHRGRADEKEPVGPSDTSYGPAATAKILAMPERPMGPKPRALSIDEIEELVEEFGEAAKRARLAGFDAIEVHGAHGTLITDFLSPLANRRSDRYGGSVEGRARLAVEVVVSAKKKAGEDFPVMFRISADEHVNGGFSLKDAIPVCRILEQAGADAIDVSAGTDLYSMDRMIPPMSISRGCNVPLAQEIKKALHIPVMVVGRINDPYLAEEILEQGKADFIVLGRALIADPEFPRKTRDGKPEDIRHCIACLNCMDRIPPDKISIVSTGCTVNPAVGRESELRIKPAEKASNVLVVGGGAAGMEAARVAALRGHKVTLVERKLYLGGNLVAAAAVSFKRETSLLTEYLSTAIHKLGVEVCLNTEVDLKEVLALKADVVIVAAGASPQMPAIPGMEQDSVTDAIRVLEGKIQTGPKVVVVGAGMIGCEVAVFLAESGKKVTLVSRRHIDSSETGGLAPDMNPIFRRWFLSKLWLSLPIEVIGNSTFREVTGKGLIVEDREAKHRLIAADTIVFAIGMKPNNNLEEKLQGKVAVLHSIGDCVKPQRILQAIGAGFDLARKI